METEAVKEVSIDTLGMKEFKEARSKGVLTVPAKVEAESVESEDGEEVEQDTSDEGSEQKPADKPIWPIYSKKAQKRIDQFRKQAAESEIKAAKAEERAAAAERRAAEIEAKKPEEKKQLANDEPQRENFQSDQEYWKAVARHEVRQEMKEQREAELKAESEAVAKQIEEGYKERAEEARKRFEDFDEALNASETTFPEFFIQSIRELDNGPDVAYFLAKNPETREELKAMTLGKAIAELGKISAALGAVEEKKVEKPVKAEEQPAKFPSKSAPPIKPVPGGNSKSSVPLDQMDMKAFKAARAAGRVS